MPNRTRKVSPAYVFKDQKALVQAGDDAWDKFDVTIKLDEARNQALIAVKYRAQLKHFERLQDLSLFVRPEHLDSSGIIVSRHSPPPDIVARLIRQGIISKADEVVVVTLSLRSPGSVLAPHAIALSAKETSRERLAVFEKLCQATDLTIYLPTHAVDATRWQSLQTLVDLSHAGILTGVPTDMRRFNGRDQWLETDWRVFLLPDLPSPHVVEPRPQTPRKRPRISSPQASTPESSRRDGGGSSQIVPPPLSSPAFPSTRTHVSDSEDPESLSRSRSPNLDPESLPSVQKVDDFRMAARRLIAAMLPDTVREQLAEQLESLVIKLVKRLMQEELPKLEESLAQDNPPALVKEHLPALVQENIEPRVNSQMSEFGQRMDHASTLAESALDDQTDDAVIQLREVRDDCIRDIERTHQDKLDDLEETASGIVHGAEESAVDAVHNVVAARAAHVVGNAELVQQVAETTANNRATAGPREAETRDGSSTSAASFGPSEVCVSGTSCGLCNG